MSQTAKFSLYTLAIYVAALFPVALLLGRVVFGIERGVRMPLRDAVADAAIEVVGFLVTASIGHVVATLFLPAVRSKVLTRRAWSFPVICGVAMSIATSLVVVKTARVLGGIFEHRYDNVLFACSVTWWSAVATALVVLSDRLLSRLSRRPQ